MMNKIKTAKIHLLRFLFLLPLLCLLFASFREATKKNKKTEVIFYGIILNAANNQPLSNANIEDPINHIKAATDGGGNYSFSIQSDSNLKFPISLNIEKEGFKKFTLPIRSLKDNHGNLKYNLYTLNIALTPVAKQVKPSSVFVGYNAGTPNYKIVKKYWDSVSAKVSDYSK